MSLIINKPGENINQSETIDKPLKKKTREEYYSSINESKSPEIISRQTVDQHIDKDLNCNNQIVIG